MVSVRRAKHVQMSLTNSSRPKAFAELAKLFSESKHLQSAHTVEAEDPDEVLRSIDFEEQGSGYQAAYSKLAASESIAEDPVAHVANPRQFVSQQLTAASSQNPQIPALILAAEALGGNVVSAFVQSLAAPA